MKSRFAKWSCAALVVGMLGGVSASPALADHDSHKHWKHHKHDRHSSDWDRHRDWDRSRSGYYRNYEQHYYYEPRASYYAPPHVYVPPPPPSFGLNLVFPIH